MNYTINHDQVSGMWDDEDFRTDIEKKIGYIFEYVMDPEDKELSEYEVTLYTTQDGSKVYLHFDFFNKLYYESIYHLSWCIAC